MKKILAVAASLAVAAFSFMNSGSAAYLAPGDVHAASALSYCEEADAPDFEAMAALFAQGSDVKYEPQSPVCFLFGQHLKAGVACLTSYEGNAEHPGCERTYYEVTYCERCGHYGVTTVASDFNLISPES